MAGPPIIQPKAGAVKAPELSPYLQYIYKLEPQRLFARVCTLHTLATLHTTARKKGSAALPHRHWVKENKAAGSGLPPSPKAIE